MKTPKGGLKPAATTALIAIILIAIGAFLFLRRHAGTSSKPATNIILITIDTLRADSTGFGGNTRVRTPFLDSLAARGRVFTNAHAHNVITLPSHANILTGLYPYQHGVHENAGFVLDAKHPTLGAMLQRGGFATGAFVGAFPLDKRFGLNRGFDTYDDNYGKGEATVDFIVQERRAEAVLAAATQWWSANEGKKRFMWVHVYDPHAPYSPPEPFFSQYRDDEYLGEIASVDDALSKAIGPILTAHPDTLVVVTGDHGEARGDHGEETHGLFAYEATLRVPLVVAGPGVDHRDVAEYVRHIDIAPTILAAANVQPASPLPGTSLLGDVKSNDSYFESLSASLNRGWAPLTGIIHSGFKYIELPIAELYDLAKDPKEARNLRDNERRQVTEARALLTSISQQISGAAAQRNVSVDEIAKLRSLGYLAGNTQLREHYTANDDPKNLIGLDTMIHDSILAFESHQPKRALEIARKLVAERPDMDAGIEILAFMLQENDLYDEAIVELKKLCAKPSASDDNRVQLALLLSQSGDTDGALRILQPRLGTNDPDVINGYGTVLMNAQRWNEAGQQFERALSIDRNNAPALQNLGIMATRREDSENALSYLSRALTLNPRLPLALNALGVVYARTSDFPKAVEAWNKAVDIDPRQYDALFNIALVEGRAGHKEEAKRALARFVATAPRSQYGADIDRARQALATLK